MTRSIYLIARRDRTDFALADMHADAVTVERAAFRSRTTVRRLLTARARIRRRSIQVSLPHDQPLGRQQHQERHHVALVPAEMVGQLVARLPFRACE